MRIAIAKRKDGTKWIQKFVSALNEKACIGCQVCDKVCPKSCFSHA